jgi:hypothetical protein
VVQSRESVNRTAPGLCSIAAAFVVGGAALALTSCSWAEDTHVVLAAVFPSSVRGDAEIAQSASSHSKCVATGGSDIPLTLAGTQPRRKYQIVLAEGKCNSFSSQNGEVVATANGGTLTRDGIRIHVNTFIHTLTKTDYILAARDAEEHTIVACGAIASGAIY